MNGDAEKWTLDRLLEYRKKYRIREATPEELAIMTEDQRWHYFASAYKPPGVHFENFRHKGRCVKPLFLEREGQIGFGLGRGVWGNLWGLRPMPSCFANNGGHSNVHR